MVYRKRPSLAMEYTSQVNRNVTPHLIGDSCLGCFDYDNRGREICTIPTFGHP